MEWLKNVLGQGKTVNKEAPAPTAVEIDDPCEEVPQSKVIIIDQQKMNKAALMQVGLGPHHWAMTDSGVGIVTGCDAGIARVTLIKPDGYTKMVLDAEDKAIPHVVEAPLESIRRAYFDEVPESRHPEGHEQRMRECGYIHSSEAAK